MNVLIVGGGGREHAIAKSVSKSGKGPDLFAVMSKKNPGIAKLCTDFLLSDETDIEKVVDYARSNNIDIAVIGPEAPLAAGIVDALEENNIKTMGPKKDVAVIEFDKAWTRNFMQKYGIEGCPLFGTFDSESEAHEFIDQVKSVAIKPAGLTGGKGVKVTGDQLPDPDAAKEYTSKILEQGTVVIEEKLIGEEFTLQAFTDGKTLAFSPAVQDHKRAFDGDTGPNTGGMGSYSSQSDLLPFITQTDLDTAKDIMRNTVEALKKETSTPYRGILYGQFILTREGPKVIEFNARFGDPEAMNILPLLETDFIDIASAIVNGNLEEIDVTFAKKATVCKYAVPEGYPDNPVKDTEISIGNIGDALLFYSSVYEKDGKVYTTGSRAVAVVGVADAIKEAEQIARDALSNIGGRIYSRKDIGTAELIQKRIDHMNSLRSS